MSSIPIEVDVSALAREVVERHAFVVQFVEEDLGFGLGNSGGKLAEGAKYPLKRLRGLDLIGEEDEAQLGRLADAVGSGAEVASLAAALQERPDASPLAVALAGLLGRDAPSEAVLAGAITGAYLGLSFDVASVRAGGAGADGPAAVHALAGVLAASGGALAATALALAGRFAARAPADAPGASPAGGA